MGLHHRHKQRVVTTLMLLMALALAADTFVIVARWASLDVALLCAFTIAIGITTAYQLYNRRYSHEHLTLVNTLTQAFLGSVLFASCILVLVLRLFVDIDIVGISLFLSLIVIVLTFAFLRKFDAYLESEVQSRFPMGHVPAAPARGEGKKRGREA